jgi:hypothetical protein
MKRRWRLSAALATDDTRPLNSADEAGEHDPVQVRFFRAIAARIGFPLVLLASIVSSIGMAAERIPVDVAALRPR